MGWFSNRAINQRSIVKEGNYIRWEINLPSDTWVSLSVHRVDGYGPNLYVIPTDEFMNYQKGLTFKHFKSFHFKNIEEFSSKDILPRGSYYIIADLDPIPDDRDSIAEFNIRYEVIK